MGLSEKYEKFYAMLTIVKAFEESFCKWQKQNDGNNR